MAFGFALILKHSLQSMSSYSVHLYGVSIEGVKNLCPMFKILVCQFRIYSPKNICSKFIINDNLQ